jgi:hypothetical protein
VEEVEMGTNGEESNAYGLLVGKPVRKRPLGRLGHRWVDNPKVDLRKIGWGVLDWIGLAQYEDIWRSLVYAVMNLWVAKMLGGSCVAPHLKTSRVVCSSIEFVS